MLVSEITNILLTGSLLPNMPPAQKPFATPSSVHVESETVQADHTRRLLAESLPSDTSRQLAFFSQGRETVGEVQKAGEKWLSEIMEPMVEGYHEDGGRRDSIFSVGGGAVDEEIELTVTVLVSIFLLG